MEENDLTNLDVDIESEQLENEIMENESEFADTEPKASVASPSKDNVNQKHKFLRLPLSRVKTIMKKDPDCEIISQDAVFLVTKATEMFIEYLAAESGKQLAAVGKRKTIMRKEVDTIVNTIPQLIFLDGALD